MIRRLAASKTVRTSVLTALGGLALSTCSVSVGTHPLLGTPANYAEDVLARSGSDALRERGREVSRAQDAGDAQGLVSVDEAVTQPTQVEQPPPAPAPDAPLEPVVVQQPRLRVEAPPAEGRDVVAEALAVPGVTFATAVRHGSVTLATPTGPQTVSVAAVDPLAFRVLTPQVTADANGVWQRLLEGDVAFTHDVGHRLQLELGQRYDMGEGKSLRIGAYASNGVPPVADAVMSRARADELGIGGAESLLVAVDGGAKSDQVAKQLQQVTGSGVHMLEEPRPRRAFITGNAAKQAFEPYTYIDNGDGMIQIDPAWVRRNIVSAKVPIFTGHVLCHRLMINQLRGALQEVVDRGLAGLIDASQYGGCWVPRHIDFNPAKPLSMHSWGLAVDFNVSTNQLGAVPQMDPRIVEIFDRWGFVWGGRWSRPDGMHFELGALLQSTGG